MKIIFLDIDGVLNGHVFDPGAQSNEINRECVKLFNGILVATGAKVVISSSWRYMILGGAMTLIGFEYMLRTHGVLADRIEGITRPDVTDETTDRGAQIVEWVEDHPSVTRFMVIDDMAFDFEDYGFQFVQTNGVKGLTKEDADQAIALLGVGMPPSWNPLESQDAMKGEA